MELEKDKKQLQNKTAEKDQEIGNMIIELAKNKYAIATAECDLERCKSKNF